MSTRNNLGETEVLNAVRCSFAEVKLRIKTAVRPRQNRSKWSHSFQRYHINMIWQNVYSETVDYIYQLSPPNQSAIVWLFPSLVLNTVCHWNMVHCTDLYIGVGASVWGFKTSSQVPVNLFHISQVHII